MEAFAKHTAVMQTDAFKVMVRAIAGDKNLKIMVGSNVKNVYCTSSP